jgi:hypothetical protein
MGHRQVKVLAQSHTACWKYRQARSLVWLNVCALNHYTQLSLNYAASKERTAFQLKCKSETIIR